MTTFKQYRERFFGLVGKSPTDAVNDMLVSHYKAVDRLHYNFERMAIHYDYDTDNMDMYWEPEMPRIEDCPEEIREALNELAKPKEHNSTVIKGLVRVALQNTVGSNPLLGDSIVFERLLCLLIKDSGIVDEAFEVQMGRVTFVELRLLVLSKLNF